MLVCALGSATLAFAWAGITSPAATVVFCIIYGCVSGTYISLSLTIAGVTLCPNMGVIGLRIGMICIPCAAGLLIGSPVGGVVIRDGWLSLQMFTGATLAVSTVAIATLRVVKGGWRIWVKC